MTSQARRPARLSRPAITSNSSSRSRWLSCRTRAPRLGSSSIRPSEARTFSASRSGVREMPEHLAELALGDARAVGNVALDDVVAQPQQDLAVKRGLLAVAAAIAAGRGESAPRFGNRGFHMQRQ